MNTPQTDQCSQAHRRCQWPRRWVAALTPSQSLSLSLLVTWGSWLVSAPAAEYPLANGVTIVTEEDDQHFAGITNILRNGVPLSDSDSRMVPLITWEWGDTPWVADRMGPATVEANHNQLTIQAPLLASTAEDVLRATYVYVGNLKEAKQSDKLPPALAEQRQQAKSAQAQLNELIEQQEPFKKIRKNFEQHQAILANENNPPADKKQAGAFKKSLEAVS